MTRDSCSDLHPFASLLLGEDDDADADSLLLLLLGEDDDADTHADSLLLLLLGEDDDAEAEVTGIGVGSFLCDIPVESKVFKLCRFYCECYFEVNTIPTVRASTYPRPCYEINFLTCSAIN